MQKVSALFYIIFGLFLVLFFGGSLILQILGVVTGLLMIRHGFMNMSNNQMFHSFTFFSQDRYR